MSANLARESEASFQNTVVEYAQLNGWKVAHFRRVRVQRKDGSYYYETPVAADGKGFPDLVLVRECTLWRELKVQASPTPEQLAWGEALTKSGQDWKIWRPSDWNEITSQLGRRRR